MIRHVSVEGDGIYDVRGQSLTCSFCGEKRSLDTRQRPEDGVDVGYMYMTRRAEWERLHAHGVAMPELPRHYRFPKLREVKL